MFPLNWAPDDSDAAASEGAARGGEGRRGVRGGLLGRAGGRGVGLGRGAVQDQECGEDLPPGVGRLSSRRETDREIRAMVRGLSPLFKVASGRRRTLKLPNEKFCDGIDNQLILRRPNAVTHFTPRSKCHIH